MHTSPSYLEVLPRAPLTPYVRCFWALSAHACVPLPHRVLPDGCLDILVDLGPGARQGRARLQVVGAMRSASVVPLSGEVCFLGIRFQPGGAHSLLRLPLHELTDGQLDLGVLWPREAREWEERLLEARGLAQRLALLEELLLCRLAPEGLDGALAQAVRLILASHGQLRIDALEEALGVGSRQLERRFREAVGLTPKVLCRISRMRHAVALLQARPATPGADLALAAGYFDQAHLVREFRALTGLTPGAYARELTGVGFVQSAMEDVP
jgi:AraC-like DNA-binding protein